MYDKELVKEILKQIYQSAMTILERFEPIKRADDFVCSSAALEKLDSICMQLIVIGESLKNLDKVTNQELLSKYTDVDWKKAKGMRDIITHNYDSVDPEAVFLTCIDKIQPLSETIDKILKDLDKN